MLTTITIIVLSAGCAGLVAIYIRSAKGRSLVERDNAILEEKLRQSEYLRATETAQIRSEREKIMENFRAEREILSAHYVEQFKALSSEILEQKSQTMNKLSRESIDAMLRPFGEQIGKFRERIEQESRNRFALEKEVSRLAELNLRITQEAENLTSALKGNSKIQGDWGEMILETLLENSGLVRGHHFFTQEVLRNEAGAVLRPDVILALPDDKQVIIDSKVSLSAYADFSSADTDVERKLQIVKHLQSVKRHVEELGSKRYQSLVNSPDFTIMFIPNEPAYLLALQEDRALWQYAFQRGVIISSPTNLFAILRIVEELWRRDAQSKNAIDIAQQSGAMYDKFVLLLNSMENIGKAIGKVEEAYEETRRHLTGRGNLISRTERIKKLGARATKQIPDTLLPDQEADDEEESRLLEG